ncbi:MAG: TatD family hydrolase [Thermodesulfobacteriota bacterium]|nr:TatD family hydrolase [Thermodesulfobacteriota bacterium]
MLVDSHAHLDLPEFNDDRSEVVERAKDNEICYILTVGINLESCNQAIELASSHDFIFTSIGIHPHDSKEIDEDTYSSLRSMGSNKNVIAYGEIGLDFYRNLSPRDIQIRRFREQINLADELGLPLIIHDRDAHRETLQILKEERAGNLGGIIHCFSGDYSMAKSCMDMGFYISIPGTITFPKTLELQETVKKLPLSKMLIETDCPFLAPVPRRGKRNEPAFVKYVAEKIASLKRISFEEVAEITSQNFKNLFHFL